MSKQTSLDQYTFFYVRIKGKNLKFSEIRELLKELGINEKTY